MKKVLSILFLLVCCLLFPQVVNADAGGPTLEQYQVIVSNSDGAIIYKWSNSTMNSISTIPVGKELTITDEYTIGGISYGYTTSGYYEGYIKISDVILKNSKYDFNNAQKLDSLTEVFVYGEDGIYLYSGPSRAYERVSSNIPAGTILKYQYTDADYNWVYTTYNGVSGWFLCWNDNDLYGDSGTATAWDSTDYYYNSLLTVKDDIPIFENPNLDSVKLTSVSLGVSLSYKYYFSDTNNDKWFYVSYNGVSGWVFFDDTSKNTSFARYRAGERRLYFLDKEGIATYSELLNDSSKTSVTIPYMTILPSTWVYDYASADGVIPDCWIYIEYNGKNYWIKDLSSTKLTSSPADKWYIKVSNPDGVSLHSEPDLTTTVVGTLEYKAKIEVEFCWGLESEENWYYTTYNGVSGWAYDTSNFLYNESDLEKGTVISPIIENPTVKETGTNGPIVSDSVVTTELVASPMQIASICVLSAIVLAVFSLVTIKLVNKKKKAKVIAEVIEPSSKDIIEENNDKAIMEEDNKE